MTDQAPTSAPDAPPEDPKRSRKAGKAVSSKAAKPSRRTRKGSTTAAPEVPRSAFNFIDDIWQHKRAVRKRNLVIAGVSAGVLFLVFLLGLFLHASNGSAEARRDAAQFDKSLAEARISEITGGVPNLPQHVETRREAVDQALALDVDSRVVLDRLLETLPSGVEIHSIEVTAAGAARKAGSSGSDKSDKGAGTAPASGAADAPTLIVSATETEMGAARRWREQLTASAFFGTATVQYGAAGVLTVEASVADPLSAQTRRAQAAQELGGP